LENQGKKLTKRSFFDKKQRKTQVSHHLVFSFCFCFIVFFGEKATPNPTKKVRGFSPKTEKKCKNVTF
jgi:Trk-type K+ transport system membrane component